MTRVLFVVYLLLFFSPHANAGKGTYRDGTPDEITIYVTLEYSAQQPSQWENMFREASKLLYDATQRQVRIRRVVIYNDCADNSALKPDVRIFTGNGGASATPDGFGRTGRIRLSQKHKTVTLQGNGRRGQFGFVHELGHYLFAVLDEYNGKSGGNSYCISSGGRTASIMDGGTDVRNKNRRTEFCWSGNHRTGKTEQDKSRRISGVAYEDTDCWRFLRAKILQRHGATLNTPTSTPTSDKSGHGNGPAFEYRQCSARIRLGVAASSQGISARDVVGRGLATLDEAASITVVSDDEMVRVPSLTTSNKSLAREALAKTDTEIALTDLLKRLLPDRPAARSMATTTGEAPSVVVVTRGDAPLDLNTFRALAAENEADVNILSHGRDGDPSHARLAQSTGGTYLHATSEETLAANTFAQLNALQSRPLIELAEGSLDPNASRDISFRVDALTAAAGVSVSVWMSGDSVPRAELRGPSGSSLESKIRVEEPGFVRLAPTNLRLGLWTVQLRNDSAVPRRFAIAVAAHSAKLTLEAFTEDGVVATGDDLVVRAFLSTADAVGDARVSASITAPNGTVREITLRDDGAQASNDVQPQDGVYSGAVSATTPGVYTIDVTANTAGARTVNPEAMEGRFVSAAVATATRKSRISAVVVP